MDTNAKRDASPLLYLVAGFLLGAIVVGSSWLSTRETDADMVRNVTIDYMYEYEPNSASGHKALAVASVKFRPGFVVVTEINGTTKLFALDRMRKFSYTPTDPS